MAVAQRLDLRQSQQLVMTPQLQQAIKMLQMSNLELTEFIKDEVERNPLLEIASGAAENVAPSGVDKAEAERPDAPAAESFSVIEETFDTGSENIFADEAAADAINARAEAAAVSGPAESGVGGDPGLGDPGLGASEAAAWATVGGGRGGGFDDLDASLEGRACREATLREHLLRQLGEATADPAARLIGAELIENLDDAGYCRQDLDEVAVRLGAGQTAVNAALALLQTFDPTGVGARSLQECLALQLSERDRLDPIMRAFLDQLPLLAKGDYARLQKICGVDLEDLRDMIAEVRGLDPKPGARFSGEAVAAVTPDVFVYENRAGGWSVELNTATLPRLLLNNSYAAEVLKSPRAGENKQIREYVSE
ncbi:MAG: RNA polymerase sigma-54 factor, partial [Pseudomonadota bacterium]